MDHLGRAGKFRAHLTDPVAQADHVVEPLPGGRLHLNRPVAGDVDAVAVAHDRDRVRVYRLRPDSRACRRHPRPCPVPQQPLRHRRAAAVAGAHEQDPPRGKGSGGLPGRGGPGRQGSQARVQRDGRPRQRQGAAVQVEAVVRVAPVEAAAPRGHQAARAKLAEMVGDQALRLAGRRHQLTDPPVTRSQLPHQPPPHRIGQQPHHRWNRNAWRRHALMLRPPVPRGFPTVSAAVPRRRRHQQAGVRTWPGSLAASPVPAGRAGHGPCGKASGTRPGVRFPASSHRRGPGHQDPGRSEPGLRTFSS